MGDAGNHELGQAEEDEARGVQRLMGKEGRGDQKTRMV